VSRSRLFGFERADSQIETIKNNMRSFFSRLCRSQIFRRAAVTLVALAWSSLAFCGEIHHAAASGDLEKVKALLKDNPDLVFSKDNDNSGTPLLWATANDHKDVAELLLANKADVNAKDAADQTPLHYAVKNGYKDMAELLLANKADVNAKENHGLTPLHMVVEGAHTDIAELLLAN
jgi:ankyrin repeat protein